MLCQPCTYNREHPSFPTRRSSDLDRLRRRVFALAVDPLPGVCVCLSVLAHADQATSTPIERAVPAMILAAASTSAALRDRKSTRLNSSHVEMSYAVFCLNK